MKRIYKYKLPFKFGSDENIVEVKMPINAKIVHCDIQYGEVFVWAEVSTDAGMEDVSFKAVMTGENVGSFLNMNHIGTLFIECLVVHIYKIG